MPKEVEIKKTVEPMVSMMDMFLRSWDQEYQTTLKLLRAYPEDKIDLKPHEKLRSARELAWTIVTNEPWIVDGILTGKFASGGGNPPPASMREIIDNYEKIHHQAMDKVKRLNDKDLERTVKFFIGPGKTGDVKISDILSVLLLDHVHHRGQLSVYQRIAGGRVPSIYGPTADEPWM